LSSTGDESAQIKPRWEWTGRINRQHVLILFLIFGIVLSVRLLTLEFMRTHLNDPGWFQSGSYAVFDRQARAILEGTQHVFWIDDATRTDLAQYPPAFPAWVAIIYKLTNQRSAYIVQLVQWLLDLLLTPLLIGGIALTAFGWRTLIPTVALVSLSPIFALYAAYPSADVPTTWFVLGGNWLLLLAAKRNSVWLALGAGCLLGLACWIRVNPLYLFVGWAFVLMIFATAPWPRRLKMGGVIVCVTLFIISPIAIRNYLTFPDFTPTGGTIGTNLWEGLGETELGRNSGFAFGDDKMIARERIQMGLPIGAKIEAQWPDGIRRDKSRVRESIDFIKQHPVWYAGVMLRRMWGMLKVAGKPVPYSGTSGINVTSKKTLPAEWQSGVLAAFVNVLGMIQSVTRFLFLPLAAFGVYVSLRRDLMTSTILLVTVLYYLVPGTAAHTEIRYVLPMHALLIVFAGVGVARISPHHQPDEIEGA
jgi:hypothetical protein